MSEASVTKEKLSSSLDVERGLELGTRARKGDKDAISELTARAHFLASCARLRVVPNESGWQSFWEGWNSD